ncbi:hypothetical protein E1A91_A07G088600v1 [Gossypium mustelinum]|uniref:Cytochrome P450 n=1 Tax=Gossypium mustelinum TaxID=34275 RepID=A0A5D2YHW2_GOSMU|nr:hypothetical protein E1A91_A07G088600v1 [Gossypium mustelinum]
MDQTSILYASLSFIFLLLCLNLLFQSKKQPQNLSPSLPSLPLIGHLDLLESPVHRFYHLLSQKHGPVFSLFLGSQLFVVVSSSAVAEECFTKNDVVLANRQKLITGKHFGYNYTTISTSSYSDHWHNLRRIGSIEIFSSSSLNAFVAIRKDEVQRLLVRLSQDSCQGFAKRYYRDEVKDENEAREFREVITETFRKGSTANRAEFLPVLNWFGGYEKKVKKIGKKLDGLLQKLVDEHRRMKQENNDNGSMVDHLLNLQQSDPNYYTDEIIKGLMLNHPEVLKKAQAEIDTEIGQENLIDGSDVSKLKYLQSIILEAQRLHPALPLLLPHVPSTDCTIGGYDVPGGTILLVNAWSVHRDIQSWDDPTSFKPERFENDDSQSHKIMPFGLGRRACPGSGLAQRVMGLTLGSLIQCFEWERVDGKEIDMTEGMGSTMPKAHPLEALCKARPIVNRAFFSN